MATLFEKIAAKKALEAAAHLVATTPTAEIPVATPVEDVEAEKKEEAPKEVGKPLSFAEKMALKKLASGTPSTAVKNTEITSVTVSDKSGSTSIPETEKIPPGITIGIIASVAEEEDHEEDIRAATPEDQQAYYDIKAKLKMLSDMNELELAGAMKELKGALLKNPQACYLLLPQDIGQMVVALRALKQEAIVEASATKKKGPKKAKASKTLTAEEIAQAFDEL